MLDEEKKNEVILALGCIFVFLSLFIIPLFSFPNWLVILNFSFPDWSVIPSTVFLFYGLWRYVNGG